jgi:hypothetical protein
MAQAIAPHFIPTKILVPLISAHHPMPRSRPHPTSLSTFMLSSTS